MAAITNDEYLQSRAVLANRFHWSFEYIDNLHYTELAKALAAHNFLVKLESGK